MNPLRSILILSVMFALALGACVSTTNPATGAKSTDWPATTLNAAKVAAPSLQASMKVVARAVAAHNPAHASEFQLTGATAAALFDVAAPTADNFKVALLKALPGIAPGDAADLADILAGCWASLTQALQQQGISVTLTTFIRDPNYRQASDLLLAAVVTGFNAGVATKV